MISVTDLNGTSRYVNADLIETIETVPETLVVLHNGHRYMVRETAEEVVAQVVSFRRRCAGVPQVEREE